MRGPKTASPFAHDPKIDHVRVRPAPPLFSRGVTKPLAEDVAFSEARPRCESLPPEAGAPRRLRLICKIADRANIRFDIVAMEFCRTTTTVSGELPAPAQSTHCARTRRVPLSSSVCATIPPLSHHRVFPQRHTRLSSAFHSPRALCPRREVGER